MGLRTAGTWRSYLVLLLAAAGGCSADEPERASNANDRPDATVGAGAGGRSGGSGRASAGRSGGQPTDAAVERDSGRDAALPEPVPPKSGEPGCGFAAAAFCDTFDAPDGVRGRGGDLDPRLWAASRMMGQLSTERAFGIGMAKIPPCRPGVPDRVWPNDDTLVCDANADVNSPHLLVAVAAQNYGQNSYRIRQPFDFAGRTGKVVFDASSDPLSPLRAWVSFAVTEDPMPVPGYSILGNDEGSVIPRNAVEVHFVNAPGSAGDEISMRNVHIFRNYVDTVHAPDELPRASYHAGKLNRYQFEISEHGVTVKVTPYSEDGVTFAAPAFTYHVDAEVPFFRGYVHVSVHNHATLKYTHEGDGFPEVVDASIARIDNVGFDGPVIEDFREYEVPDSLVRFTDPGLGDPHNTENVGYDIGWQLQDATKGPRQVLHLSGVDLDGAVRARLAFAVWLDFNGGGAGPRESYAFRARVNGKGWHERKLSAEELAFFTDGPTTRDPSGAPIGDPASQGRLALLLDIPLADLVAGDNTLEFVSVDIPTGYPPLICNVDLVLQTD